MTTPSASHLTLRLPLPRLAWWLSAAAVIGALLGMAAAAALGLGPALHGGAGLFSTFVGIGAGLAILWAAGSRPVLTIAAMVLASSFVRAAVALGLTFAAVRVGGLEKVPAFLSALLACLGCLVAETRLVNDHIRAATGAGNPEPVHG